MASMLDKKFRCLECGWETDPKGRRIFHPEVSIKSHMMIMHNKSKNFKEVFPCP